MVARGTPRISTAPNQDDENGNDVCDNDAAIEHEEEYNKMYNYLAIEDEIAGVDKEEERMAMALQQQDEAEEQQQDDSHNRKRRSLSC